MGDTTINNNQYIKICQSTDTLFEFLVDYPFYCAVREEDSTFNITTNYEIFYSGHNPSLVFLC